MTESIAEYDIVIVGAGRRVSRPGCTRRARRRTLLLERKVTGGQIALTADVENYPGIDSINGFDLATAMHGQAAKYGMETAYAGVTAIDPRDDGRHLLRTGEGDYVARAVILTGGADYNRLGVPGEERLTGFGVSYCATCDAAFFRDQGRRGGGRWRFRDGGGPLRHAIRAQGDGDPSPRHAARQRDPAGGAFANAKMKFVWNSVVEEILGEDAVSGVRIRNVITGETSVLDVTGVFVFVGLTPNTAYLKGKLKMDDGGHIYVNEWMETDVPGIFAAGDIRANSARQVVTAAGDGATAAIRADHYIIDRFGSTPASTAAPAPARP